MEGTGSFKIHFPSPLLPRFQNSSSHHARIHLQAYSHPRRRSSSNEMSGIQAFEDDSSPLYSARWFVAAALPCSAPILPHCLRLHSELPLREQGTTARDPPPHRHVPRLPQPTVRMRSSTTRPSLSSRRLPGPATTSPAPPATPTRGGLLETRCGYASDSLAYSCLSLSSALHLGSFLEINSSALCLLSFSSLFFY